jgi:hypothetical protein
MDAPIRIIKDYDLVELSLVDNPANQFASILSVQKVDGVDTITGDAVNIEIENVFWDKDSGLVTITEGESAVSPVSGIPMQNIGFVEKSDTDKVDMIKFLVDSAKGINVAKMTQEDNMTEQNLNDVPATEEVVEDVAVEEIAPEADAVVEAPAEDGVEKAAKPDDAEEAAEGSMDATESSQDEEEEDKEAKKSEEITDLKNSITSAFSEILEVVKAQAAEIAELKKSQELTNAKIADAENDFTNLGKSLSALEADTAFRKSGDLGEIVQEPAMVEKSVWGGRFLTTSDILK